jgi:hypothetical protein
MSEYTIHLSIDTVTHPVLLFLVTIAIHLHFTISRLTPCFASLPVCSPAFKVTFFQKLCCSVYRKPTGHKSNDFNTCAALQ